MRSEGSRRKGKMCGCVFRFIMLEFWMVFVIVVYFFFVLWLYYFMGNIFFSFRFY